MPTERLELALRDDDPESPKFVADLAGDGGPGLVVLHEWWGLNDGIRARAERFAAEGFTTLAPDLYGQEPTADAEKAAALATALQTESAMEIVARCVRELSRRTRRKVGVTGFCLGGAMTFAAAASVEGISAVVPFYGNARPDYMLADRMRCPIQAHFAYDDPYAKGEPAIDLARDLRTRGRRMDLFFYEAGHAFMREEDAEAYDAEAATLAWTRAIEFLKTELR